MTNYESGKFIAQTFSHHISRLLKAIYDGTVEPHRKLNDFEKGVIDEIKSWVYHSGYTMQLLKQLEPYDT